MLLHELLCEHGVLRETGGAAFRAWFGNSQAVDADGRPLRLYHGTPTAGFDSFAERHKGRRTEHAPEDVGFHFTDDPEFADAYSASYEIKSHNIFTQAFGREPKIEPPQAPAIYPVYLSMQHPLRLRYSKEINRHTIEQAKKAGHDGIIADHGTGTEYVVFHPSQIKSAVTNRGSYDPASENLSEADALVEAPIGNLEVHGMEEPGTFPDVDRKLLSNPAHIQKIRKQFELNTYDFDMYFINQIGSSYLDQWGSFNTAFDNDNSDYTGQADPKFLHMKFDLNIQPKPDTITVVYLSNANQVNSVSLTPWIVAHRFAHALTENPKSLSTRLRKAMDALPSSSHHDLAPDIPQLGSQLTLAALMTNRSARMGMHGEFKEELIAQYLITGNVKLALRPDVDLSHGVDRSYVDNRIASIASRIRQNVEQILNECVGKIFVSV